MAKTARRDQVNQRKAKKAAQAVQAQAQAATAKNKVERAARRVQVTTLGDLIAAAFDTVGGEAKKVARVISSPTMTVATGTHIVFVG